MLHHWLHWCEPAEQAHVQIQKAGWGPGQPGAAALPFGSLWVMKTFWNQWEGYTAGGYR